MYQRLDLNLLLDDSFMELTANVARVPAKKALSQLFKGPFDPDAIQYGAKI